MYYARRMGSGMFVVFDPQSGQVHSWWPDVGQAMSTADMMNQGRAAPSKPRPESWPSFSNALRGPSYAYGPQVRPFNRAALPRVASLYGNAMGWKGGSSGPGGTLVGG